ncbi:flagellar hook-associated protein FlgL [Pollutimonas harenae]|uniref:Flagellar hook-associated protein FlgL n=1 Tax=Pollutimonas harenae TaxID=657015 RepID=A0A853GXH8_9BURK|nr:flagellar hook-associated protein FlgL [Pollutimonas harenae]NYT87061.1 flagellar hook-associated protein FlgL [Pollutimonas harenae]TEA71280.1 flagellar hook-associated protein 3 [Pollutimonas harenae]
MRISSTLFFQTGLNSINAQQSDLMHLYQQIGSGQRMVTPADDPLAAAQAINISQSQSLNKRFAENRSVLNQNLGIEENTLNSVTTLLQDVKTRLIEAGNGTMSDADRATLSNVLSIARTNLLSLANATDGSGQYLFSGAKGNVKPFQEGVLGVVYEGDQFQRKIQADQTRTIAGSDVGTDVFSRAAPGTTGYLSSAAAGNTGTAVVGSPAITDPRGEHIGHTFTIAFTSATDYTVTITDANGANVGSGTGSGYVAGSTDHLTLPGGVQVSISGTPQEDDVFVVEPISTADDLNVFKTLDGIIAALADPTLGDTVNAAKFQNALGSAIQRMDVTYNNVLTVRASVGARMNEIDALDANGAQRALSYSNQLSKMEDVDYYSATAQLQLRTAALEAASLAFRKIQATGLFNMGSN